MPWDPVKKQWRSQRDIDLDRGVASALGTPEERNLDRLVSDIDPSSLRNLISELQSGGHALKQRVLSDELQRLLTVNRDFSNVTGEGAYNPGSFPTAVPNWNTATQSNPENTSAFRGPAGIPSRWRRPPNNREQLTPTTWSMLDAAASEVFPIPSPADNEDAQIAKLTSMLMATGMGLRSGAPGVANMLAGTHANRAPIKELIGATKEVIDMPKVPSNTFKLTLPQAAHIWHKYQVGFGADGLPRWEIQGSPNLNLRGEMFRGPLDKVYDWPELYRAYPQLRKIHTEVMLDPYVTPSGYSSRGLISAQGNSHSQIRSVLTHEGQHHIDRLQPNWSRGGDPKYMHPDEIQRVMSSTKLPLPQGQFEAYMRLASEVQARAAEQALRMSPAEKLIHPPQFREDRNRDVQLLRFFREE